MHKEQDQKNSVQDITSLGITFLNCSVLEISVMNNRVSTVDFIANKQAFRFWLLVNYLTKYLFSLLI